MIKQGTVFSLILYVTGVSYHSDDIIYNTDHGSQSQCLGEMRASLHSILSSPCPRPETTNMH